MKLLGKRKKITSILLTIFFISIVIISFNIYSKPINAALVDYSRLKQVAPDVYMEPHLQDTKKEELLLTYVQTSLTKISDVFGDRESYPYIIYVESQKSIKKYAKNPTGQAYYYPWKNYIVIGPKGLNENVISHEFTHAELRGRLHNKSKVPVWFDEGLAAMVDGRYSNNKVIWSRITNNGKTPVDFDLLDTYKAFSYGTIEASNSYNLACYEVTRWFTIVGQSGLLKLINELNEGGNFKDQYKLIEIESNVMEIAD